MTDVLPWLTPSREDLMESRPIAVLWRGIEPCPPELAHLERPKYGGTLDYNTETGLSGCTRCGWKGVPSSVGGYTSTWCPHCSSGKSTKRNAHPSSRRSVPNLRSTKRKAAKQQRKRNRK